MPRQQNNAMEEDDALFYRQSVRPVGALESLGEALSAVFDEEITMWKAAAQSYSAPHRSDQRQRVTLYEPLGLEPDDELSIVTSRDPQSQSDEGSSDQVESGVDPEREPTDDSLAAKWAEVEKLLASIRPDHKNQQLLHGRRALRVVPTWRGKDFEARTRSPLGTRRHIRQHEDDPDDRNRTLQDCQCILTAWAELTRARADSRAKNQTAGSHWRQSRSSQILSKWRTFCQRRQWVREKGDAVARVHKDLRQAAVLRHWWTIRRWTRGQKLLKAWRDQVRRRKSVACWREIVDMSRQFKLMRLRALRERMHASWARWEQFVETQKIKRGRHQAERSFCLHRYFQYFATGIRLSKVHRCTLTRARQHHQHRVRQSVLHDWIAFCSRQRRVKMAKEWWTHCTLSSSFESWHLLHRCFVYRDQQNQRARACYATSLRKKSLVQWQTRTFHGRHQRLVVHRVIVKQLQRACFAQLRRAVAAERARSDQLQQWRARRYIQTWHMRAHRRAVLALHQERVDLLNRSRLLHGFAWPVWREAYHSRLRVARLTRIAERHFLRIWWRRWRDRGALRKAHQVIRRIVDNEREQRQQRRAVRYWRRFCVRQHRQTKLWHASVRHSLAATLRTNFHHWRLWLHASRMIRIKAAQAEELYRLHSLRRWKARARGQQSEDRERVDWIIRRHVVWLQRSWLETWRRHVRAKTSQRVLRVFCWWRHFVMRAHRDRALHQLGKLIRLRHSWCRWGDMRDTRMRLQKLAHALEDRTHQRLLHKALIRVWHSTKIRFCNARQKLQTIGAQTTTRRALHRWRRHVVALKHVQRATEWHRQRTRLTILRSLYQFLIQRPRELRQTFQFRTKRLVFTTWGNDTAFKRSLRRATEQFHQWRQKKAVVQLERRCARRQLNDSRTLSATTFYSERIQRRVWGTWLQYTASMLTCREAFDQVRTAHCVRVFRGWRRALARQNFVHELEAQFENALLFQSWSQFREATRRRKHARLEWLSRLCTLLLRKMLQRWRRLVELQQVELLVASSRCGRVHKQVLHQAFDEWTHFVTVRAFAAVHRRRAVSQSKAIALRQWKLLVVLQYRARVRDHHTKRKMFSALKSYAIQSEASREVQYRSYHNSLLAAWRVWRVEFWITQSQGMTALGLLRRCVSVWRLYISQSSRLRERELLVVDQVRANSYTRRSPNRLTAFHEATILQHIVQRQRVMMQRVVHAWALAAQTRKRQRRRNAKRFVRVPRCLLVDTEVVCSDLDHGNRENLDRNTSKSRTRSSCTVTQDEELLALEHWSTRLLKTVFDEWRASAFPVLKDADSVLDSNEEWA